MSNNPALISPEEVAQSLGKSNPEPIREALRAGTFPVGSAYKTSRRWVYIIPRKAWEHFMETGRVDLPEPQSDLSEALETVRKIAETALVKMVAIEAALKTTKRRNTA